VTKRPTRKPAVDDVAERFVFLLDAIWQGNRSSMSAEIGCSQAAISQIATGKRPPGRRLLTLVSGHPKVNPAWLLTGSGEPLLAARGDVPSEGWPLPVVKDPLPGLPSDYKTLLTGFTFPAAGAWAAPSRYWLEVQPGDAFTTEKGSNLSPLDFLLIETNTTNYLRDRRQLCGRIGIVNSGTTEDQQLTRIRFSDDETAAVAGQALNRKFDVVFPFSPTKATGRQQRQVHLSETDRSAGQKRSQVVVTSSSLVGICLALVRTRP